MQRGEQVFGTVEEIDDPQKESFPSEAFIGFIFPKKQRSMLVSSIHLFSKESHLPGDLFPGRRTVSESTRNIEWVLSENDLVL